MDLDQLKALPKVELHCHLDGSLSLPTIRRLAKLANIAVPEDEAQLRQLTQVTGPVPDLMTYLTKFDFVAPLLQTEAALEIAAYDVLQQAALENVRYMEIRFAPAFSVQQGLSYQAAIQAVLVGMAKAKQAFNIEASLLVCGMRQQSNAQNIAVFKAASLFKNQGLGGVDFAGNEADFPPAVLQPAADFAQQQHLNLTFHAGECHCAHNIYEAIHLGARRIGHGTALADQPDLAQLIKTTNTCLELCLTSNLQTKAIQTIEAYPYPLIVAQDLAACINTDNRTVSNTTLTKEYALFQKYFHTDLATFLNFNLAGIEAAFCTPQLKTALRREFKGVYAKFS